MIDWKKVMPWDSFIINCEDLDIHNEEMIFCDLYVGSHHHTVVAFTQTTHKCLKNVGSKGNRLSVTFLLKEFGKTWNAYEVVENV